jgi:UDP-galactopyranose mutase
VKFDSVIVGAGVFGCTLAEKLASRNKTVFLIDKRSHIGGNAFSSFDSDTNIEIHKYGSHIFHTNNENVWNYVNQFSAFNSYVHKVKIDTEIGLLPVPINLETLSRVFDRQLDSTQAKQLVSREKIKYGKNPENLEDWAKSEIGIRLYELLIKGYTKKQWETDPKHLPSSILTRLPVRFDSEDRYFTDKFQGMPSLGYEKLFKNMIDSPKIKLQLETDYFDIRDQFGSEQLVIYTGPIDKYFDFSKGYLNWRTLDFGIEKIDTEYFQPLAVINSAFEDQPYTRTHEFKHFYPERVQSQTTTIIAREFSRRAEPSDEPYYPVGTYEDKLNLAAYKELVEKLPNVYFGGRLGSYQYLDMHMAINQAHITFQELMRSRWN